MLQEKISVINIDFVILYCGVILLPCIYLIVLTCRYSFKRILVILLEMLHCVCVCCMRAAAHHRVTYSSNTTMIDLCYGVVLSCHVYPFVLLASLNSFVHLVEMLSLDLYWWFDILYILSS